MYGVGRHLLGQMWGEGWSPESVTSEYNKEVLWKKVRQEYKSGRKNLIVSAESLTRTFMQAPQSLIDAKNYLEGMPVTVIVYLRRQGLLTEFWYNQKVKAWLASKLFSADTLSVFYDCHHFLQSFFVGFGKDNIVVCCHE